MMKNAELKHWILFAVVFILFWIGLDFLFSLLRAATFVFARALKTATYSAVTAVIVLNLLNKFEKKKY